jgi:hypothetical protein
VLWIECYNANMQDHTGKKVGLLTVVSHAGGGNWNMVCDCGSLRTRRFRENMESCGCAQGAHFGTKTHGEAQSPTWYSWQSMKSRCNRAARKDWKYYGGRGIKYTPHWEHYENFRKDMGLRPKGKTLDRIDTNGMYCKENCKWSTHTEQMRNRRKV